MNNIDQVIENDIDVAIEEKHEKEQYNFEEEMENAENTCCEECEFWDAFTLKHGIARTEIAQVLKRCA